jgi:hypothetical protein
MQTPISRPETRNLTIITDFYWSAKNFVVAQGFESELLWQESLIPAAFSETDLLRESAWVILCSGFRETVVRRIFDYISLCFCDWESADVIHAYRDHCRALALSRFGNVRKVDAIVRTADYISGAGFEQFKECVLSRPVETLQLLPYIGEVTTHHLAKNLGIPTAKPDRHLKRMAASMGFDTAYQMCDELANATGDAIQVVDLVLWRYSERLGASGSRGFLALAEDSGN